MKRESKERGAHEHEELSGFSLVDSEPLVQTFVFISLFSFCPFICTAVISRYRFGNSKQVFAHSLTVQPFLTGLF